MKFIIFAVSVPELSRRIRRISEIYPTASVHIIPMPHVGKVLLKVRFEVNHE